MTQTLIWLHEEALRMSHPVFTIAPAATAAIFIWDDGYFRRADYSLKRLVFIYETIAALPIEVIRGNTVEVMRAMAPSALYVPASNNPQIVQICRELTRVTNMQIVGDESFAIPAKEGEFKRFSHYWKQVEHTVFKPQGGVSA